jgi:diguanylate cyclase (GGDEF)-like protein/PAS domain S-box-containing protein
MGGVAHIRYFAYAMAVCIASALAGIGWLSYTVIAQGQDLSGTEDVALDLLIGIVVLLSLGGLVLRQQSRGKQRHEQELEQEKVRVDIAINHMSQGLVMFDASQRIALCNTRYIELYGMSPAIVKRGLSFRDLTVHRKECGSFSGDVDEYCRRTLDNLKKEKVSGLIITTNGGRVVRVVNTALEDGGWVATHQEITEFQRAREAREQAEAAVRQQKLKLDVALDNMIHGLCMFDADGRIVLFNSHYSELMGEPEEYLQGLSLIELFERRKANGAFSGDPHEFFSEVVSGVRAGKTMIREVERGDTVLRVIDHPMEGGGWVATMEDITETRRAERERDRNRAFLDLIIDNVPSAIFAKRASDRTYVLVNRTCEQLWGLSRQSMLEKTAREVFPEIEASKIEARDDQLLESIEPVFDEREILTTLEGTRAIFSRRLIIRDGNSAPQYILGVIDDVTERKAAEERIAHLAHYDPLTDLPNRALFREQLEKELSIVRRGGQLAVLYLDLDHFKGINDTLGHPVGDELLKQVAQRLRSCLRDCDLISRLGGDEFAIIQTALQEPKDAEVLARRLREVVTEAAFDLNGHLITVDLSVGIALAPADGTEIDDLVKHADLALYGAKAEGRANYRYYEPEMNARMKRRRDLETNLRTAIANDELLLYYQPLINLWTGDITGCEGLLRWQHPQQGMIPPAEFVPVAEETGLIHSIGEWVLRRACMDAMNWPSEISVAVNVSPVQFRNHGLALIVIDSLRASGLPPNRLELEITESVLMQNSEATLATLHEIRNLGVRISMDDFGTGYSSLSYLRRFPFDKIKIDQSFIGDLSNDEEALAVVRAILSLADSLKMSTTAEGVETAAQRKLLSSLGCDQMQGYQFSYPRPAAEIESLLSTYKPRSKVA